MRERPHAVGSGMGLTERYLQGAPAPRGDPRAAAIPGRPDVGLLDVKQHRAVPKGRCDKQRVRGPGGDAARCPQARTPLERPRGSTCSQSSSREGDREGQGRSQHGGGQQQDRALSLLRRLREIPGHAAPCPAPPTSACPRLGAPGSDPPEQRLHHRRVPHPRPHCSPDPQPGSVMGLGD